MQEGVYFSMPFEVRFLFLNGSDSTARLDNNANDQTFTFTFKREPIDLTFDPSNQIVLKSVESIRQ